MVALQEILISEPNPSCFSPCTIIPDTIPTAVNKIIPGFNLNQFLFFKKY